MDSGGSGGRAGRSGGVVTGVVGVGDPVCGIDIRKDGVAEFNFCEPGVLFRRKGLLGEEGEPERFDFEELFHVGTEAKLSVIAGGSSGDEELPVRRLEQEKLAAKLFDDALAEF